MKRVNFVLAAVALWATHSFGAESFGKIEPAKDLMGRAVHGSSGKVGDIKDFVVDLESGRILYSLVSADGKLVAIPTQAFTGASESRVTIQGDKEKFADAPEFENEQNTRLKNPDFAKRAHQHFGQPLAWEGSFNNVHKASELIGMNVENVSDQKVGDISNLGLDLRAGRIAYVILGSGGVLGVGDKLYVMPPNAFTLGSDAKTLVTGIDKERLEGAPMLNNQNWRQISDPQFATRVYKHYDKQPYWSGAQVAATSREDGVETPNSQGRISGDRNERISRERNRDRDRDRDEDGLRVRRGNEAATRPATGAFANVEDARRLIGMNVENARSENLGKLSDIVVDLESGRVLYGVVDLKGEGAMKAVAPANLVLRANDKSIRFNGDQKKLENAPAFNKNSVLGNSEYAARVYGHFGQQPSWFSANDKFGNVHRASDLLKMKVQNVEDKNVGQVQNLMVDLQKGRVLYVILNAAQVVGRNDNLFALPPNAFTMGRDQNTLVTSVDKAKLEGAPRGNIRELNNPSRAEEIYRYYGKQAYWTTGNDLSPTGRD